MVTTDKTFLREYIYEIISEIIETKQGAVEPCMAHIDEIRKSVNVELMECLRGMFRDGVLAYSVDVNKRPMFKINRPLWPTTSDCPVRR